MRTSAVISRRCWLDAVSRAAFGALVVAGRQQLHAFADEARSDRIRRVIDEYSAQGLHRTGTRVDERSGDWLADLVRGIGATPMRERFSLSRVDPVDCRVVIADGPIAGLPLFDAAFTNADGVGGTLGPIGSDAEIGLVDAPPNTAGSGALGDARRQNRHRAIVCITGGGRPGLCPNNADAFLHPFGPPVAQVSSEQLALLRDQAQQRTAVRVVASVTRASAASFNVTATIAGARSGALPPLIVMTPRSGWYTCASERGGGIACWLELMRALRAAPLRRDAVFVASSGHELGHLGIDAFVAKRPGIVGRAAAWMHFGANIGAATRPDGARAGVAIQSSDAERERVLNDALAAAGLAVGRRVPHETVPGGEAEVVHRSGGRYVSVIGANALFHNPQDRGAATVDVTEIARFADAFGSVARALDAS